MRFLFSVGLALLGSSLVSGQSCTVKSSSVTNFGSTGCSVADSNSVDIIGTNPVTIPIPTFDTSAHPIGTVLDAVYLNFIVADYQPTVTYQVDGPTTNFVVGVSVPNTWTLFSNVDNRGLTKANLNSVGLFGEASVDATDSDSTTGCIAGTDGQAPPHSLACLNTGILVSSFSMFDTTYQSNTLSVTTQQTFSPDYSQPNTYTDFAGPSPTASSGFRITTGTPGAGYSSSGASTWGLTTSASTAVSTAARVQGTFSGGGSGGHLTINVAHHLFLTVEVQYDFHTPAGGSGDPQFQGFQGQQFQVHGAPDAYFALISAPSYYVNARFDYISTGSCTYNETACFTHPGTYMGMIYVGMKDSNILIQAGPHATGFASILVNDKPMTVGDRFSLVGVSADSYIQVLSKSKLVLTLDNIILTIHNSDLFVNFDLALTDQKLLSQGSVKHVVPNGASASQIQHHLNKWYGSFNPLHGLIGQTWRNVRYQDNKLYQGDVTEYQLDKIIDHTFLYCVYEP